MGPDGLEVHSEAATKNALMGDAKETQGLCRGTELTRRNSGKSYDRATRMGNRVRSALWLLRGLRDLLKV